ncbi:MAG: hypothetical protein RL205_1926, partial [Actinomycetota bacterium]
PAADADGEDEPEDPEQAVRARMGRTTRAISDFFTP